MSREAQLLVRLHSGDLSAADEIIDYAQAEHARITQLMRECSTEERMKAFDALNAWLQGIIDREAPPPPARWIPVAERLPPPRKPVLVVLEGARMVVASLREYMLPRLMWENEDEELVGVEGGVTHWMPLPEPPR